MSQEEALDILKMGHSVFLTGAAGTGKTFVLNKYIQYLKTHSISPIITASTGIASTHIGGQTIHSWSGIGILEKLDKYTLDKLEQNEKLYKKYENVKVLIIDEISMLHASRLDMINTLFKKFKKSDKPFAGIQIIFCGDFFQLPPVVKNYSNKNTENIENDSDKEFAYNSNAWKELNPVICYLSRNYRQEDEKLLKILGDIRFERNESEILKELEVKTKSYKQEKDILKLYTHNIDVDAINEDQYKELGEVKEYTYEMTSSGKKHIVENLKNNCLAGDIINLKIGTKVIFVKNDQNKAYQNGTLGEVIDFANNDMPIVETFDKKKILVKEESWQQTNDDGKVLGEISQIPLRYAWAITIHKSQGMTLDAAEIDLGRAFGSGMGYVALSRVKEFKNINLVSIGKHALRINSGVLKQDKIFQEKSERASLAIKKYFDDREMKAKLKKKQEDFITYCGGSLAEVEIQEENFFEEAKPKIKTTLVTLELVKQEILPKYIAEKRNLTLGTIVGHIEELFEAREIKESDIEYIFKDIEKHYSGGDMKIIKKILMSDRGLKAKHDELNKKHKIEIDFSTLKLLRLKI
ncbi:MAG: ATP-dependent helicase [Patescibacteria group bacterium]|nr:ATP-dependent helicase [Patescibacteria group bacterium]